MQSKYWSLEHLALSCLEYPDMAHRIITCDFGTGLDTQNMGIPKSLRLTPSDQKILIDNVQWGLCMGNL